MTTNTGTSEHMTKVKAQRAALYAARIDFFVEIAEKANINSVTVKADEMRVVLEYLEWLVTEFDDVCDRLEALCFESGDA